MQQLSLYSDYCLQLRISGQILHPQTMRIAILCDVGLKTLDHAMQMTEKAMARLPMGTDKASCQEVGVGSTEQSPANLLGDLWGTFIDRGHLRKILKYK